MIQFHKHLLGVLFRDHVFEQKVDRPRIVIFSEAFRDRGRGAWYDLFSITNHLTSARF